MCGCGRTSTPLPGANVTGPIWSRKTKGPTMRRCTEGSARRTSKRSPRSWVRGTTTTSSAEPETVAAIASLSVPAAQPPAASPFCAARSALLRTRPALHRARRSRSSRLRGFCAAIESPCMTPTDRPSAPRFRDAFAFWLKLGSISFGGPAGQIAVMHQELVERRRWISERRFLHALNYCMLLPGPEAQQLATYIGWLMYRTWGGIVAGGLFVLPSLFILLALSWGYIAYGAH